MTALLALPATLEVGLAFLAIFAVLLAVIWLELHRPLTAEEKREMERDEAADPWAAFGPAGKRRRLEAELARKEEGLRDMAVITAAPCSEYVSKRAA